MDSIDNKFTNNVPSRTRILRKILLPILLIFLIVLGIAYTTHQEITDIDRGLQERLNDRGLEIESQQPDVAQILWMVSESVDPDSAKGKAARAYVGPSQR